MSGVVLGPEVGRLEPLIWEWARAVKRRKWIGLAGAVIALAALTPLTFWATREPPRYRSSSVVIFKRPSAGIPLAILNSREFSEAVVAKLQPFTVNELAETSYSRDYSRQLHDAYRRLRGIEPEKPSRVERAVSELPARMTFQAWPDKSQITTIRAEASHPVAASDVANTVTVLLRDGAWSMKIDAGPLVSVEPMTVTVIDPASRATPVGNPRRLLALFCVGLLALGGGAGVAATVEVLSLERKAARARSALGA